MENSFRSNFLSWMSFQEILEFLNFLYAIGMLLEFAAFIRLRLKKPDLHRPYKVPLRTFGVVMLCLPPALMLVLVMCLASLRTFFVSGAVIVVGFVLYPILVQAKNREWMLFEVDEVPLPSNGLLQSVFYEIGEPETKEEEDDSVELLLSSASARLEEELALMQNDSKSSQ